MTGTDKITAFTADNSISGISPWIIAIEIIYTASEFNGKKILE